MDPLVTIVTPSYNSELFIGNAIRSVVNQTVDDWEMIIIDDCSSDETVKLAREFSNEDSRIKLYILNENSGAAVARNKGIEMAAGRYIFFLDSDDTWMSRKLELQLNFFNVTGAGFIYSSYQKVSEDGSFLGVVSAPRSVGYNDLLKSCSVGCLTAAYDTKVIGKVEMPLIRKRQDLGLWLKILKKTRCGYGQSDVLATYTVRDGSISSNKANAAKYQWRLYRDIEGLSFFSSFYYFCHYAIRGVFKNNFPLLGGRFKV